MTEKEGFRIKIPSIIHPEGYSVIKPMLEDFDRENREAKKSRALLEKRLAELPKPIKQN